MGVPKKAQPSESRNVESTSAHVLLVDNYDSFTYNARDLLQQLGAKVVVKRNDEVSLEEVRANPPQAIVLSPGPGRPRDAGVCLELVRTFRTMCPILGICLGHQVIVEAFGGRVVRAQRPLHGQATSIRTLRRGLFAKGPSTLMAARYHSLVASPEALGTGMQVTCRSEEGEVMGVVHRQFSVEGLQFHPESYMTPKGPLLLERFLRRAGVRGSSHRSVVR